MEKSMLESDSATAPCCDPTLSTLGAEVAPLSDDERDFLDANGYLILPNMMDAAWLSELRQAYERLMTVKYGAWQPSMSGGATTDFWNHEQGTRRLTNLVSEDPAFDRIYLHPRLLAAVLHVTGRAVMLHSLNARDALPGQGAQALHVDGAALKPGESSYLVNTAWLLDDFTAENGSTRVILGSHRIPGPISEHVADLMADHPAQQIVEAPAGSVLVFNAHLWHSGRMNRTRATRRVIHCAFVVRDRAQGDIQRDLIRKSVYERISPAARYLLNV